jgi:hypothetical protein
MGTAGSGGGNLNVGVAVVQAQVTSSGGTVSVSGTGGGNAGASLNLGVAILGGTISAGGTAPVSVTGTGGLGTNGHGVDFNVAGLFGGAPPANITASGGNVTVTGTPGTGADSYGINLWQNGTISTTGSGQATLIADSIAIDTSGTPGTVNAGNNTATIRQKSNGVAIDLGGTDSAGTLGLTDAELDRVLAGTLRIGNSASGAMTVSADITRAAATVMNLIGAAIHVTGGLINSAGGNVNLDAGASASFAKSGIDVDAGAGTLAFGSGDDLSIAINGATLDTQYQQLNVAGLVNLSGVDLVLGGSYTPVASDSFIIVANDGVDPITGTFNGLAEGATVSVNGTDKKITYVGGTGNDVALIPLIATVPTISIADVTRLEPDSGIVSVVFTVQLSAPSAGTVSVAFATADGSGPAGATAPDDYTATNGRLTFQPGQTRASIRVAIEGDTVVELDETFFINLSDPINVVLGDAQATGTILNDDVLVRIGDASVREGNAGVVNANFTVTRSASQPVGNVTVAFSTADGTATAGSDYTATSDTLTFMPGELAKTITVPVFGDLAREANETFFVNLTSVTNAVIADKQGKGTIVNDDSEPLVNISPALSVSPVVVTEPDSGSTPAEFLVTLSKASGQVVSVRFTTANGTARAGRDYKTMRGTLAFAPGQTQQTISVPVFADLVDEPDETFFVRLSSQQNAELRNRTAQGTIKDHPSPGRHRALVYQPPGKSCGERYDQKDNRADKRRAGDERTERDGRGELVGRGKCDLDYTGLTGKSYFARETSTTVAVSVLVDRAIESDETFTVDLDNAVNAVIGDGMGAIFNDD